MICGRNMHRRRTDEKSIVQLEFAWVHESCQVSCSEGFMKHFSEANIHTKFLKRTNFLTFLGGLL